LFKYSKRNNNKLLGENIYTLIESKVALNPAEELSLKAEEIIEWRTAKGHLRNHFQN
jgi:hypothetical protein